MLVYLDMFCFNRPYDAQTQLRIRLETEAKLRIREMIRNMEISGSSGLSVRGPESSNAGDFQISEEACAAHLRMA
jgi:hypothetical protein